MQEGNSGQARGLDCLQGGGECGALMRAADWSSTAVGPVDAWPQSLKIAVRILLTSRYAMWMGWGPELTFFYNDAYAPTLGVKHRWALGRSAREVWKEIWPDIGPRAETVMGSGVATWDEALLLFLERSGYPEETYHTFSYSPVPDDNGGVGGMLCVVTEDTERVIGARRLSLLRELASDLAPARHEDEVRDTLGRRLGAYRQDLPFTLTYLFESDGKRARLLCATGLGASSPAAPAVLDVGSEGAPWPAAAILGGAGFTVVEDLAGRFDSLPAGPWEKPARQAAVVAIAQQGQDRPAGLLVAALSPYRPFDAAYRGFIELIAGQIAAGLANAHAYEQERKRAEALAELDRAKTNFFSNVSHEFRTPLALILGPIEDMLARPSPTLPAEIRESLAVVHRNGQRLLKLVNSLLEFSRIEAGRVRASFEPTDLAAFTAELASVFRSAVERAGMRLHITCPPLPEPIFVDRDMWEKIVLNLVSNAFKYTLDGEIRVSLLAVDGVVKLTVADTGTGIPAAELPRLFNRFHRVEGARGRTHEGTGIGLALVYELVKLHGGTVQVESELDKGSCFTVTLPRGSAHLPADQVGGERRLPSTALGAKPFVEEALRWLPRQGEEPPPPPTLSGTFESIARPPSSDRPTILLADDNADMREYMCRLLRPHYEVIAAADGEQALGMALLYRPDLVLTDVMMPNLDGFGLMRALRQDSRTASTPLIMLSARAGEEARVEGLGAGADDYLIKPFSARELLARIGGTLALARARREALRREEELRAETTNILESIAEGFVRLDPAFRITYLNAEAERMNRIPRAELLGQNFFERYPAIRGTAVERELRRVMSERVSARFEAFYDPWSRWFEIDAYPASANEGGIAVYLRDITGRKRQAEQLQALAKAAVAVNSVLSVDDTLQVVTARAREIIGAHQATTVLGPEKGELGGAFARALSDKYAAWRDIAPAPSRSGIYRLVCEANRPMRMSQAECDMLPMWKRIDLGLEGQVPIRGWLAAPLVGRDGKNLGVIQVSDKYVGDFTDGDEAIVVQLAQMASVAVANAQLYKGTQEARAEAEVANQMKDQFLATLSHELRTPLNAILGWARILQTGRVDGNGMKEGLEVIERNSKVQAQLIADLLDISRIISGKLRLEVQRLYLIDVIEAALAAIRPAADAKEIRLQSVLDPLAGPVRGDPARLQQVVWNLLSNAVKFTGKGGRIQVILERSGSQVEISVIDTGQGIRPDFLPFMFDKFRQADSSTTRRHGGLGLGLSIVRQLVEMHGGTVRAMSPGEGKGATFTIALPIVVAHEPPSTGEGRLGTSRPEASRPPAASLAGVKVLVVDDEPDARELIKRILTDAQAEVETAGSVPEALVALERFRPSLLLSDIGMPEQDGYELMHQVRARGRTAQSLPAVALTAFARPEDRRRALLAGFQVHITKPVDPEELVAVVASLMGRTGAAS